MKITNTTKGDIGLQPDLIVHAGGSLDIASETLTWAKALPSVKHHFVLGHLVEASSPAPKPANPDRAAIIAGIIRGLGGDDFTKGGKPEVSAINAAMVRDAEPVTAAERDAVWDKMEDEYQ